MSVIDKLLIQGIRSVGPDKNIVIEFQTPLTLIVGFNGAGKTTIIECLRYAATGQFPPNTNKGQAFVHDPKLANRSVVKAKVKLRFRDCAGNVLTCSRTLTLTQKPKSLQLKTIESTLQLKDSNNEISDIGQSCGDLDKAMASHLGVSPAVLDYVIFCHQESSNWPLEDAKLLKEKFDLIFDATRYTKALEVIKKQKKEIENEGKIQVLTCDNLRQHRNKSTELSKKKSSEEERLARSEEQLDILNGLVEELKQKLMNTSQALQDMREMDIIISREKAFEEQLSCQMSETLASIVEEMKDTDQQLETKLATFDYEMQLLGDGLEKYQKCHQQTAQEIEAETGSLQEKKLAQERLKLEVESHKKKLADATSMLEMLKKEFSIEISREDEEVLIDLDAANYTVARAVLNRFANSFFQLQNTQTAELNQAKNELEEHRTKSAARINEKERELREQKHAKDLLKEKKIAKLNRIRELDDELARLPRRSTAVELGIVEAELLNLNEQLSETKSQRSSSDLTSMKSDLGNELITTNTNIAQYENDRATYMKQSTAHAMIERLEVKERELEDANVVHTNNLQRSDVFRHANLDKSMLQNVKKTEHALSNHWHVVQEEKLKGADEVRACENKSEEISATIERLGSELQTTHENIGRYRRTLEKAFVDSGVDIDNGKTLDQLYESGQTLVQIFEQALIQADIDLEDSTKTVTHMGAIQELTDQLRSRCKVNAPCPACDKKVANATELKKLISNIEGLFQIRGVDYEKTRAETEDKREKLNAHNKTFHELSRLIDLVPELEKQIDEADEMSAREVESLDDAMVQDESLKDKEKIALQAHNEIKEMLTNMEKLEDVRAEIDRAKIKLVAPKTSTLSIEALTDALEKEVGQRKTIEAKIKDIDRQMLEYEKKCVQLENNIMKATHECNQIKDTVQKRADLEKSKVRFEDDLTVLEQQIQAAGRLLRPLNDEICRLQEEYDRTANELSRVHGLVHSKVQEMNRLSDKFQSLIYDVERFDIEANTEKSRERAEDIQQVTTKLEKLQNELCKLNKTIAEMKDKIQSQSQYKKDINTNLSLRKKRKQHEMVKEKIIQLTSELNDLKADEIYMKHDYLNNDLNDHQAQASQLQGKIYEIRKMVQYTEKELNDPLYRNILHKYNNSIATLQSIGKVEEELGEFHKMFDNVIMQYHRIKMNEINKVIKDLWNRTYTGTDIDSIEICSEYDGSTTAARRNYNYRVVMKKGDTELDMKGRCSAGQKVLASLVIRLSLADTFCINCGIIALDEPTANLDKFNLKNFAASLNNIIDSRRRQRNFQIVIITHDEEFLEVIGSFQKTEKYWKVTRDEKYAFLFCSLSFY
eukprot:CFRG2577T1